MRRASSAGSARREASLRRASHEIDGLIDVERLRQIFERTALVRSDCAVEIGMRGHDDDRQLRLRVANLLQQLEAAAAGHADVGDQHVGPVAAQGAASAVSAWSNAVGAIPPWRSARSSTQRIEASSSTSQTLRGFS